MRVLIILAAVAAGLASTALADPYKDLAAQGYRWVSVDGPYACRSKDDLRKVPAPRVLRVLSRRADYLILYYI
jgi:predicted alpha/beta-hydrolase family hydrolase